MQLSVSKRLQMYDVTHASSPKNLTCRLHMLVVVTKSPADKDRVGFMFQSIHVCVCVCENESVQCSKCEGTYARTQ